jgi:thiosulfate/3-mercaptopyruvate sulfurtransferase
MNQTPLLVSTDWLEEHLSESDLRIVDIRGHVITPNDATTQNRSHYPAYLQSHIPGAVFIDWIEHLCDDPNHLRVAEPQAFARLMSDIGVDESTLVVAYDDTNGRLAARLWWALHYYGHTKAAILDGGWNKWHAEDRATSTKAPQIGARKFTPRVNEALRRQGDEVLHMLNSARIILDMRSPEEFSGEATLARLAGHIPGAVNLPITALIREDGTLHSPDELRQRFAQVDINGAEEEVVAYSNVGVDSSLGVFALRVAGFEHGSNYDTSWQEWGNDEQKPIE